MKERDILREEVKHLRIIANTVRECAAASKRRGDVFNPYAEILAGRNPGEEMKIREGFVSNSSSSSFVIDRSAVTPSQIFSIVHHIDCAKELGLTADTGYCAEFDAWTITLHPGYIRGYTSMDNFDMRKFLNVIGVDASVIDWD